MRAENVATISGLQERVLHDRARWNGYRHGHLQSVDSPLGDAAFLNDFRAQVLPRLRTFPYVRIWVAGCGAGDDAYALAMLCREAQFAHRVRIYATDAVEGAIERARTGKLAARELDDYQARYAAAGGTRFFEDYIERSPDRGDVSRPTVPACARTSSSHSTTSPSTARSTSSTWS